MEVRIQPIHGDASEQLVEFINKKADNLARRGPAITVVDVTLKVVKPETSNNKEVVVRVTVPQAPEVVANKVADTFEEAYDLALEAVERQISKNKDKK